MEQMKNAVKHLERLCSAVAELPPTTESVGEQCRDPEILRSIPGVGPIVLAALISEGHDALMRRDAQALRSLAGVVPVTRRGLCRTASRILRILAFGSTNGDERNCHSRRFWIEPPHQFGYIAGDGFGGSGSARNVTSRV
ncbi:hypothetical protein EHS39_23200 [Ensifer sp. MPMI2T]|nr:hypothetical protein EHS39_23200 [Ensifer sp. MPMI2T]